MSERRFTVRIDAEMGIGNVASTVQKIQSELNSLKMPSDLGGKITGTFAKLTSEIEKFQAISAKGIGSTQEFNQLASSGNKIIQIYEQLSNQVKNLGSLSDSQLKNLFPPSVAENIKKATSAFQQYENAQKNAKGQIDELTKQISKAETEAKKLATQKNNLEKKKAVSDSTFEQMTKDAELAKSKFEEAKAKLEELQNQAKAKEEKAGGANLARKSSTYRELVDSTIPEQEKQVANLEQAWIKVSNKKEKALSQSQKDASINNLTKDIEAANKKVEDLKNKLAALKVSDSGGFAQLIAQLNQIKGIQLDSTTATIEDVKSAISGLTSSQIEQIKASFSGFGSIVEGLRTPVQDFNENMGKTKEKVVQADNALSQVDALKSRVNYFFGLTNSVYLFKRAITSALNTVKELDAVMTETAVVTDFTVGDMWEKLPEYASHANALGASIKDVYAATTLYYQQGLQTNAAMSVGVETMKMARIAGMEAAEATEAMTAALRGFNMEVNKANAVRVNDVYSELAAITAADTEQIATAMSKTASIASSANMEFETTAALLAQIIETTQEAPETAGTALKTIIARFSEVKKLREEGQASGEDEEGEAIDVNKIQGALRTVGISMDDFFAGTEGLDSILLKLAEKWGSLDFETQRYIATMAAGSRQQSRFIAMMSDYERTMELATAANNSAGASQQQFDKTLESIEAKLQKLSNAWDEFTMGLANNQILKGGIDLLTGLVTGINKLTDVISRGNGAVKSVLNLGTALLGLKTGGAVLSGILASISSAQAGKGFQLGKNVKQSFSASFAGLKNIQSNIPKIDFDTAGLKTYQASLAGYQASLKQVSIAQKEYQVAVWQSNMENASGAAVQNAKIAVNQAEVVSKQQLTVAAEQLAAATGLENQQAQQAILLNSQGLSLELSVAAAKAGTTAAELKEAAVKQLGTGATEAAVAAKMKEILAQQGIYVALNQSIIGRIEEIVMTKLGTVSTLASAAAHWLEAKGIQAKTAAMLASLGVIGLVIVAVGVLIGLIVAIGKALYNASPAGQLKAAQEAADGLKNSVDNATEAYNNLVDSMSQLEDKYVALEELTKGTKEWRDAVQEINGEVLDLVDKYPELAAFLETKDGVLSISKEKTNASGQTYDDIVNGYSEAISNNQASLAYAQAEVIKKQTKVDYQNYRVQVGRYSEQILEQGQYVNYAETDEAGNPIVESFNPEEITNSLAMAIASDEVAFSFNDDQANIESFTSYLQSAFDLSAQAAESLAYELSNESDQLYRWGTQLVGSQDQIDGYNKLLVSQVGERTGLEKEDRTMAENYMTANMLAKEIDPKRKEVLKGGISEDEKREFAQKSNYKYENGKFFDVNGAEVEGVTNEVIATGIATANSMENLTDKMNAFANAINKTNLKNLYKKEDGQALTSKDFAEAGIEKNQKTGQFEVTKEQLTDIAETMYNEIDENGQLTEQAVALQEMYTSSEEFAKVYADSMLMGVETYNKAISDLASFGAQDLFSNIEIDSGTLGGMVDNLYEVFLTSGPKAAQGLAKSIEETLNGIEDPEQAQIFADALNAIDWQNLDSVEELETVLVGMDFDYAIDGLDELKQEIITAAKATKTFNLDAIKEQVKSVEELVADIEDREDTERTFTKEERDLMVGADASLAGQFIATGIDEFVYVGDSIGTLITALDANTAALLSKYGEQVIHNAEMSDKWQNLADNGAMWTNGQNEYQVLSSIAQSGSLEGYNTEGVIGIMEKVGMGVDSGRSLGGYTPAQLAEIIMADYGQYGSELARNENAMALNDYNTNLGQIAYQDQQKTDRQLLEDSQGSGQNQQYAANQIAAEAAGYSEVSDELAKYNDLLDENGKLKDESQKAAYDAALKEMKFATEIAKAKKEMKDYGEEIDESLDGLEDIEEGTEDYKEALDDMAKQTNKYLDSDIDGAFLEQGNNLELLEDALEGDADAWEQFNRNVMNATAEAMAANADMVTQFGIDANEVANMTSALDALEFDVNGTADVTQLINEFLAAGGTASEVAAYLEQLGLTNIDLVADVEGVDTLEQAIEAGGGTKVLGTVKATNVRLAPSSFSGFTGGGGRKSSGGGGGGGGGGSEPKKWENSYDEFYNTVEKLNEELRTREKLERRYQKLLDNTNTKASDLVKNAREQLASLEEERKTREYLLKGRERQMADIEREYNDLSSYASYNEEKQVIEIDWTKIEALDGSTNEELTSRIEEYIGKLEEQQDLIEEEQDSIAEIEDAVKEIREQGKDEYFDFESQIRDALEQSRQEEIDKLSAINDSINDTNSRLIEAMQSSIDKYRQDRENERTEEELSDKQRRLAYLQQDTSGANALEILKLQEEITQGQEDYTDTLIDQKISELQEQNDEAAEQRQQQIDLMQAQLDHYLDSELVWADIYSLMNSGIGPDGIIAGSALEKLLMEGASFEAMSYLEKMKWLEELENNVAKAVQWLMEGNSTESLMAIGDLNKGQKIEFTTADGKKISGTLDEAGNVITDSGEKYEGVYRTYNGAFVTQENYVKPEPPKPVEPTPEPEKPKAPELTTDIKRGVSAAIWNGNYGWGVGGTRSNRLAEVFGANDIQRNYVDKYVTSGYSGSLSDYSYINMRKKFKQYKTGGLADFTGPAWLDGTKSKPEYILNAEQTKSFFQLVDVLDSLKSGATQSSQITGDSIYDVDINVESIGNDYDVEQLASTIKRMINDDARYRNNNAINLQR